MPTYDRQITVRRPDRPVLDPCCGARKFYVDKDDPRVLFCDIRRQDITQCDGRVLSVNPDQISDFRDMPFADESFSLVVFDPPHLLRSGPNSWMSQAYGKLADSWQNDLQLGFSECFRVLKPYGTLVFKWSDSDIPLRKVLALTPEKPVVAEKYGRKKHWIVFFKAGDDKLDAR